MLGASAAFSATVPPVTSTATVRVVRVRYVPDTACHAVDTTITPVAVMAPIGGTNNVRATIAPAAQATRVGFTSANTGIATVVPAAATASPQVLQIGGVANDETLIRARTATSGILRTLTASSKPRLNRTVAIHAVSEQNDDVQVTPVGQGEPNQTCVTAGPNGIINSVVAGDDVLVGTTSIHTGPNGICNSTASGDDVQVIAVGQGRPNRPCVGQGPNGFRDTRDTQILGDDTVAGNDITSGPNGICQTAANATNLVPVDVPTAAALQTHLNAIWGLQANIFFAVTRTDAVRNYDLNRDGNLSDPPDFGSFNEVDAMSAGVADPAVNFNIYFVRGYSHPVAYTETTRDEAYVGDAKLPTTTALFVVAHEMGHLLGMIGHNSSSPLNLMFDGDQGTNPCEVRRSDWRAVNP